HIRCGLTSLLRVRRLAIPASALDSGRTRRNHYADQWSRSSLRVHRSTHYHILRTCRVPSWQRPQECDDNASMPETGEGALPLSVEFVERSPLFQIGSLDETPVMRNTGRILRI